MNDKVRFILTGTHSYGPINENSDLDIVVMREDVIEIMNFLNQHGINMYQTEAQGSYNDGGFYFDLGFIKINIIIATTAAEFMDWSFKTREMQKAGVVGDREERLRLFQSFSLLRKIRGDNL